MQFSADKIFSPLMNPPLYYSAVAAAAGFPLHAGLKSAFSSLLQQQQQQQQHHHHHPHHGLPPPPLHPFAARHAAALGNSGSAAGSSSIVGGGHSPPLLSAPRKPPLSAPPSEEPLSAFSAVKRRSVSPLSQDLRRPPLIDSDDEPRKEAKDNDDGNVEVQDNGGEGHEKTCDENEIRPKRPRTEENGVTIENTEKDPDDKIGSTSDIIRKT